ncbi:MAG: S-layer homology domain-containing protein [Clostridiales bacterium]|jgi:hypothetical protein|nr:S-layer homology domain-containing protein [Clostridiales bacterium]
MKTSNSRSTKRLAAALLAIVMLLCVTITAKPTLAAGNPNIPEEAVQVSAISVGGKSGEGVVGNIETSVSIRFGEYGAGVGWPGLAYAPVSIFFYAENEGYGDDYEYGRYVGGSYDGASYYVNPSDPAYCNISGIDLSSLDPLLEPGQYSAVVYAGDEHGEKIFRSGAFEIVEGTGFAYDMSETFISVKGPAELGAPAQLSLHLSFGSEPAVILPGDKILMGGPEVDFSEASVTTPAGFNLQAGSSQPSFCELSVASPFTAAPGGATIVIDGAVPIEEYAHVFIKFLRGETLMGYWEGFISFSAQSLDIAASTLAASSAAVNGKTTLSLTLKGADEEGNTSFSLPKGAIIRLAAPGLNFQSAQLASVSGLSLINSDANSELKLEVSDEDGIIVPSLGLPIKIENVSPLWQSATVSLYISGGALASKVFPALSFDPEPQVEYTGVLELWQNGSKLEEGAIVAADSSGKFINGDIAARFSLFENGAPSAKEFTAAFGTRGYQSLQLNGSYYLSNASGSQGVAELFINSAKSYSNWQLSGEITASAFIGRQYAQAAAKLKLVISSGVSVTGKVTDAATGDPVNGAPVALYIDMPEGYGSYMIPASTDESGRYSIDAQSHALDWIKGCWGEGFAGFTGEVACVNNASFSSEERTRVEFDYGSAIENVNLVAARKLLFLPSLTYSYEAGSVIGYLVNYSFRLLDGDGNEIKGAISQDPTYLGRFVVDGGLLGAASGDVKIEFSVPRARRTWRVPVDKKWGYAGNVYCYSQQVALPGGYRVNFREDSESEKTNAYAVYGADGALLEKFTLKAGGDYFYSQYDPFTGQYVSSRPFRTLYREWTEAQAESKDGATIIAVNGAMSSRLPKKLPDDYEAAFSEQFGADGWISRSVPYSDQEIANIETSAVPIDIAMAQGELEVVRVDGGLATFRLGFDLADPSTFSNVRIEYSEDLAFSESLKTLAMFRNGDGGVANYIDATTVNYNLGERWLSIGNPGTLVAKATNIGNSVYFTLSVLDADAYFAVTAKAMIGGSLPGDIQPIAFLSFNLRQVFTLRGPEMSKGLCAFTGMAPPEAEITLFIDGEEYPETFLSNKAGSFKADIDLTRLFPEASPGWVFETVARIGEGFDARYSSEVHTALEENAPIVTMISYASSWTSGVISNKAPETKTLANGNTIIEYVEKATDPYYSNWAVGAPISFVLKTSNDDAIAVLKICLADESGEFDDFMLVAQYDEARKQWTAKGSTPGGNFAPGKFYTEITLKNEPRLSESEFDDLEEKIENAKEEAKEYASEIALPIAPLPLDGVPDSLVLAAQQEYAEEFRDRFIRTLSSRYREMEVYEGVNDSFTARLAAPSGKTIEIKTELSTVEGADRTAFLGRMAGRMETVGELRFYRETYITYNGITESYDAFIKRLDSFKGKTLSGALASLGLTKDSVVSVRTLTYATTDAIDAEIRKALEAQLPQPVFAPLSTRFFLRAYPKINFMACESHALKHRDDFHCATEGILGYALRASGVTQEQAQEFVDVTSATTSTTLGVLSELGNSVLDLENIEGTSSWIGEAGEFGGNLFTTGDLLGGLGTMLGAKDLGDKGNAIIDMNSAYSVYTATIGDVKNFRNSGLFNHLTSEQQESFDRSYQAFLETHTELTKHKNASNWVNGTDLAGNGIMLVAGAFDKAITRAGQKMVDRGGKALLGEGLKRTQNIVSTVVGVAGNWLNAQKDADEINIQTMRDEVSRLEQFYQFYYQKAVENNKSNNQRAKEKEKTNKPANPTGTPDPTNPDVPDDPRYPYPPLKPRPTGTVPPPYYPPNDVYTPWVYPPTYTQPSPYNPRWTYDPAGFAWSGAEDARLSGVLAELWTADDEDGANARFWSEAPDYDQANPQITGEDGYYAWDTPTGWWQVRVSKDGYESAQSAWLPVLPIQLGVNLEMRQIGAPPSIFASSLPNGKVGSYYTQTLAASGTSPITWSLASGALPNGLALSAAGVISGTPSASGTFNFAVTASNGISPDAQKGLSITIAAESVPDAGGGSSGGSVAGWPAAAPIISSPAPRKGLVVGGNTIVTPEGQDPVKNPDGSYTLPGGGTVTTPGNTVITVPPNATLSKDGQTLKLPNGRTGATVTYSDKSEAEIEPGLTINIEDQLKANGGLRFFWRNPFTDVKESDWFFIDARYAYTRGLMSGVAPDKFSPQGPLSRGMIIAMLYRHAGSPAVSGILNPFTDVPDSQYYADAAKWATAHNVASGIGGGKFAPEAPVTRQDLAVLLSRYADFSLMNLPVAHSYVPFKDEADIAPYALEASKRLFSAGIIEGRGNGIFDPKGLASRAEAAAMLHRFLEAAKTAIN